MMVSKELKGLPKTKKTRLKHEINNLIFQFQEEHDEENIQNVLNSTDQSQVTSAWDPTLSSAQTPFDTPWPFRVDTNLNKHS